MPERLLDPDTARAAYAVVDTTLHAAAERLQCDTMVDVQVEIDEDKLQVRVDIRPAGKLNPALFTEVQDRVGALGGHLVIADDPAVSCVRAVIPCAS